MDPTADAVIGRSRALCAQAKATRAAAAEARAQRALAAGLTNTRPVKRCSAPRESQQFLANQSCAAIATARALRCRATATCRYAAILKEEADELRLEVRLIRYRIWLSLTHPTI